MIVLTINGDGRLKAVLNGWVISERGSESGGGWGNKR
jgi:hypothetical protein